MQIYSRPHHDAAAEQYRPRRRRCNSQGRIASTSSSMTAFGSASSLGALELPRKSGGPLADPSRPFRLQNADIPVDHLCDARLSIGSRRLQFRRTSRADAAKIDPSETSITPPDAIHWSGWLGGFPPHSAEMAMLHGCLDKPGPYLVLKKWYPGYMSAPTPTQPTAYHWFSPEPGG